jgi:precorrin-8X/cobalt-precorrin-8 methylmutase
MTVTPRRPEDILAESFRIIEAEIGPHAFGAREWPVVRRLIHATGDLDIAKLVRFHDDPVGAALTALARQTTIVTDVTMVLAGIDQRLTEKLNVPLQCFLNRQGAERPRTTRSASGFEQALGALPNAIYVVGNAPTALITVCEAVREGRARPALIVAMPVGFVAVVESKEAALCLPVPIISIVGRKGGSALAAAAVNALLHLACEGAPP